MWAGPRLPGAGLRNFAAGFLSTKLPPVLILNTDALADFPLADEEAR